MYVAYMTVDFSLDGNDSMKVKQRVANSLKLKIRNKFNVSVAEADTENSYTELRLAILSISNAEGHLRSRMNKCLLMIEAIAPEKITDSSLEIYATD